jgi:mono/diheme cytochrome c family protein
MKIPHFTAALAVTALFSLNALAADPDGKALYTKECGKCHGPDGKGQTKMGIKYQAKDYTLAKTWEGLTDEKAVKAIKEGFKDKDGKVLMKPTELTDAEAKAIMAYMKTFKK